MKLNSYAIVARSKQHVVSSYFILHHSSDNLDYPCNSNTYQAHLNNIMTLSLMVIYRHAYSAI